MNIQMIPIGPAQANCYFITDSDMLVIIDPGDQGQKLVEIVNHSGMTPAAVLLTHGHFDHVGGVNALCAAFPGLPVYLHPEDEIYVTQPEIAYRSFLRGVPKNCLLNEKTRPTQDTLQFGELVFKVLHTPGHTRGSVCYLWEKVLFTGDTLFMGSCGRWDLFGGDELALRRSLRNLASLKENFTVYTGHGQSTTLAAERAQNPFLKLE